jgi:sulfide:quinone oxidoreductase
MPAKKPPFRVLVAGGGVAALEAALALRDLAGPLVATQILAPGSDFAYRPLTVGEPFSYAPAKHYSLAEIAADIGAELIVDGFAWLEPDRQVVHTEAEAELTYDALLLALGARMRPAFSHAVTIDDRRMDELLHGIVQDVEAGYVHSIAFVAPARMGWPLPIYELALLTAHRAFESGTEVAISVITPEDAPLAIFGTAAGDAVAELLSAAGITLISSARAQVPQAGQVVVNPGDRTVEVDRIVALPELFGPSVRGLSAGEHGFIPIDRHCQVRGAPRVFAAGDATDFAVKFGGLAAQQADTAAQGIAALAGAKLKPEPFHAEIHGILMTGGKPRYLTARLAGGRGFSSEVTDEPPDRPMAKISARYLTPYLAARDAAAAKS